MAAKRSNGKVTMARVIESAEGIGYAVPKDLPEFEATKDVEAYIKEGNFDGDTIAIIRVVRTVKVAQEVKRRTTFLDA